ncbi:MAG: hypothetical protein GY757_39475 [bacterium]|nr:hypothetical protein [bacterium]
MVGDVNIEYSTNSGSNWTTIASTENDGEYDWTISDMESTTCRVRISQAAGGVPTDTGDADFTIFKREPIPSITLLSPEAGFEWQRETTHDITWEQANLTGDVTLDLYKDGSYHSSLGTAAASSQSYTWNIPAELPIADDYQVHVYQGAVEDYSDGTFSIIQTVYALKANPDFNGDGKPDILWRNTADGRNAVWFMDNTTFINAVMLDDVSDLDTRIGGTGDFNNDGKTDILWRNTADGRNAVWFMDGVTLIGWAMLPDVADLDTRIAGTGDFNGDGKTDILWRRYSDGKNAVWYMDGVTLAGWAMLPSFNDPETRITGTGDFNGDGKTDIIWRRYSDGNNAVWFMDGTSLSGTANLDSVSDLNWKIQNNGDGIYNSGIINSASTANPDKKSNPFYFDFDEKTPEFDMSTIKPNNHSEEHNPFME